MNEPTTKPMEIAGVTFGNSLWQQNALQWPYGEAHGEADDLTSYANGKDLVAGTPNTDDDPTAAPQEIRAPDPVAVVISPQKYGRRGLQAISEWEAVVESVDNYGFKCRLLATKHGAAASEDLQLTEFSYDDLASDDDHSLVMPGAVLYWTVGRARNAAGTVANVSLLRVRRLPDLGRAEKMRVDSEAAELLRLLSRE